MRRATRETPPKIEPRLRAGTVGVGDYMCSDRELYRVEQVADGRALIEDCRTGELIDTPVHELSALRRLRSGAGTAE